MKYNNRYADKKLKEGVELEIEGGTVKDYAGKGDNIVISEGITEIGDHAFGFCEALKEITVPKAAKIHDFAFAECEVKIIGK